MLKTIKITSFLDKKNILQQFELDNSLWITSDIKSKTFILDHLKKNDPPSTKDYVLRAKDFWIKLLSETEPEMNVVSRNTLCLIYKQWIQNSTLPDLSWQKTPETGQILCEFISMIAHILQYPHEHSPIKEWLDSQKQPRIYWKKWYTLSQAFYDYLIEKKVIETSWVDSHLLDKELHFPQWKELIFDLGSDINPIESELIKQLSKKNNITVLAPFHYKDNAWQCSLAPYHSLLKPPYHLQHSPPPKPPSVSVKKFASMLAEIKDITVQIKKALKTLKPSQVSVLAPNIEDYWPCLKSHLLMEGIPFKKTKTASLISFPDIQIGLAKMWTHLSIIEYENLETLFYSQPQYELPVTKFQAHHLHTEHINNVPPQLINKKWLRNRYSSVSAKVFTDWAKLMLPQSQSGTLHQAKTELFTFNTLKNIQLPFESWLTLFSSRLREQEYQIKEEKEIGIQCLSMNALNWISSDFIYIAGLSEQNLKTDKHHFISSIEADFINEDLGFIIKTQAIDKWEQSIAQFIQREHKNLILSFAASNFHGETFNPSVLWLEQAQKYKRPAVFDSPELTNWDKQKQKKDIQEVLSRREMSLSHTQLIDQSIKEDKELKPLESFFTKEQRESSQMIKKLSASSLQDYARCPFIFASKKLFKLWDGPQKDVDMDLAEKGNLIHQLFEKICLSQIPGISDQDMLHKVEEYLEKFKKSQPFIHPTIWEKEKNYLLEKTKLFLEHERKLKKLFKNLKADKLELKYNCFWNQKKKCLDKQGEIEITGFIDRIDKNTEENTYFIIDYKKTLPTGGAAAGWSQQNNFQLGLYMQAVELGLTDLPPHVVEQALYLSYKDFKWMGYAEKTPHNTQLFNSSRSRSLISKEKKNEILSEINTKINTLLSEMQSGRFTPKPFKESYCSNCRWSKICRAAHLN